MSSASKYFLFMKGKAFYYKTASHTYRYGNAQSAFPILMQNEQYYGSVVSVNKSYFIVQTVGIINSFQERVFFSDLKFVQVTVEKKSDIQFEKQVKELIEVFTHSHPFLVRRITTDAEYKHQLPIFLYLKREKLIRVFSKEDNEIFYEYVGAVTDQQKKR